MRHRQAGGKRHQEDADMAGGAFLHRASRWRAALPLSLPCRREHDMAQGLSGAAHSFLWNGTSTKLQQHAGDSGPA